MLSYAEVADMIDVTADRLQPGSWGRGSYSVCAMGELCRVYRERYPDRGSDINLIEDDLSLSVKNRVDGRLSGIIIDINDDEDLYLDGVKIRLHLLAKQIRGEL